MIKRDAFRARIFLTLSIIKLLFVCNRGDTEECHDGLRTRKLGQSPINVSATYDGKCNRNLFFTMVFVVTLGQTTTQPFLDFKRTGLVAWMTTQRVISLGIACTQLLAQTFMGTSKVLLVRIVWLMPCAPGINFLSFTHMSIWCLKKRGMTDSLWAFKAVMINW